MSGSDPTMDRTITPRLALGASSLLLVLANPLGPAAAAAPRPQTQEGSDATVVGRVVGVDGVPVAGVPISVVETDTGDYFPLFNPLRPTYTDDTTESASDGTYRGVLPRAYIPGRETDFDWIVTASRPAGPGETEGPNSSFEFETNTAVQEAPDLPVWDAAPVVSVDGYRAEVSIPGGKPLGSSYASVSLNSATKPGPGGVFDLRAAEPDASHSGSGLVVRGQARADVTVHHAEGRTIYHQTIESAQVVADVEVALEPVSRDAPCVVALADGQVPPDEPCQATDGRLHDVVTAERTEAVPPTTAAGESFARQPEVVSITVELAGDTPVGSVSVRGCERTCDVEISADGSTWASPHRSTLESIDSSNATPVLIAGFEPVVPARFVRVGKSGATISVSEISAWPPGPEPDPPPTIPPTAVAPRPVPAPEQAIARPVEGSPAGGREVALPVVAAVLVTAVGAGLVGEATRRRRAG